AFGDARYLGGLAGSQLNAPITGMAAVLDRSGYRLAGADGGVFAFGSARYVGGLAGRVLNGPIVGLSATWDGAGYWLAGSDGGVFSFGDAGSYGSLGGVTLSRPVIAVASGLAAARLPDPRRLFGSTGFDLSWPQCPAQLPGAHA